MSNPLLQFFSYEHLPPHLREVSKPFAELAHALDKSLPSNPESSTALRKLLEAKDCAVRSVLWKSPAPTYTSVEAPKPKPVIEQSNFEFPELGREFIEKGGKRKFIVCECDPTKGMIRGQVDGQAYACDVEVFKVVWQ